jgi:hypothetical protein
VYAAFSWKPSGAPFMNRTQLKHIIRAASRISDDAEIVVGGQAIHTQDMRLPPIAYISEEADVYPRNHTERADDIDLAIGRAFVFSPRISQHNG